MTIPANVQNGVEVRPTQHGPVFYIDPQSQRLQMRYTARTRSIEWKSDSITQSAVAALRDLLNDSNPYVKQHRMGPGEGLISNNVIHSRSAFNNGDIPQQGRLLYRVRSYDRINTDSAG